MDFRLRELLRQIERSKPVSTELGSRCSDIRLWRGIRGPGCVRILAEQGLHPAGFMDHRIPALRSRETCRFSPRRIRSLCRI